MPETETSATVSAKPKGGRPPKYVEQTVRRLDKVEARLNTIVGKSGKDGLVPPGVLFKDILCAWVASGRINPTDTQMVGALMNNAEAIYDAYRRVSRAALKQGE